MAPKLGILLADAAQLEAALAHVVQPEETTLFLMDDAVLVAADPRLAELHLFGAELALCATDAETRGVGPVDGVRAGSQYDHAIMMRDAERVIALTGARVDEHAPGARTGRRITVHLTRDVRHSKTAQALRSAVGYAAADLKVTILLDPPARALLAHRDHPEAILRALGTLRGLGHRMVEGGAPTADIEVTW